MLSRWKHAPATHLRCRFRAHCPLPRLPPPSPWATVPVPRWRTRSTARVQTTQWLGSTRHYGSAVPEQQHREENEEEASQWPLSYEPVAVDGEAGGGASQNLLEDEQPVEDEPNPPAPWTELVRDEFAQEERGKAPYPESGTISAAAAENVHDSGDPFPAKPGIPSGPLALERGWRQEKREDKNRHPFPPRYNPTRKRVVVVDPANLGVDVLGRPATAMVMRDLPDDPTTKEQRRQRKQPVVTMAKSRDAEAISGSGERVRHEEYIQEQVEDQSEATLEEARANIEELRPGGSAVVPESEFRALGFILLDGFTAPQLRHYVRDYITKPVAEHHRQTEPPRYSWIRMQNAWQPDESYEYPVSTPKERMVLAIMKGCWKLQIQEMLNERGLLQVKIGERILKLLLRGNKPLLYEITEKFLDEGDRIEISKPDRRLSIYATKAKTETVLDLVDKATLRMHMKSFSVPAGHERLDPDHLEELGRITNTVINYDPSVHLIRIAWVRDPDAPDGSLESPAKVVLRLLSSALHEDPGTARRLVNLQPDDAQGSFAVDLQASKSNVPGWRDRLFEWSRYVLPSRRVGGSPVMGRAVRARNLSRDVPIAEDLTMIPNVLPHLLGNAWSTGAPDWPVNATVTVASFGHVLHTTRSDEPLPLPPRLFAANHPRTLSPVTPPPSAFAEWGLSLADVPLSSSVLFRFRVDPAVAARLPGVAFPSLELLVSVFEDQRRLKWADSRKKLYAVSGLHRADVMMPGSPVDVRLTQYARTDCAAEVLELQDSLEAFFGASDLDLAAGRLVTPAETLFVLPSALLRGVESPKLQRVLYGFTGLEVRQTVETTCAGHRLCFGSVEAGHHGGRRSEISLVAIDPPSRDAAGVHTKEYLRAVQDVARGKHFAWSQGRA